MSPRPRALLVVAAVSVALATGLGAYASHGLQGVLSAGDLGAVLTAIDYQFYHSLGLVAVAILDEHRPRGAWLLAAGLLMAGLLLFSGGIYARVFGPQWVPGVAPAGGLCFIAGWLVFAYAAWTSRDRMLR